MLQRTLTSLAVLKGAVNPPQSLSTHDRKASPGARGVALVVNCWQNFSSKLQLSEEQVFSANTCAALQVDRK